MGDNPTPMEETQPGFCSGTCVDRASLQKEIKKPELKTSDLFITCNLPKRFEHPRFQWAAASEAQEAKETVLANPPAKRDWFNGYGCQISKQHPFYRTSASVYGWYAPGIHSVPTVFFPKNSKFTEALAEAGMYRNYSLNTKSDPVPY